MTQTISLPIWLFVLIMAFAAITFASHFLLPSVRWFFRKRLERAVKRLNERLERPIQPFKLARRTDMIQRLIYDPDVTRAIVEHARTNGVREDVAFELARRYAREIVPSFSAFAYFGFAIRAARMLSNALYRVRMGYHAEDALAAIDPDATVVFVMNHRSNMDYVLVTYLAADRSALSYAVGEWAHIWPLSRLIRAMGAYFIRRRSRNALYRRVLARYVAQATQAGVTQAMFPEGGLSLDGALAEPKLGLLKYIVDAGVEERDVVFVPVALNYDRVLEDTILINAGEAGGFALKTLWLRITGRFHRFGYAAVSFGAPLSLRVFLARDMDDATHELGHEIMARIGAVVPVLPVPLAALALEQGPGTAAEIETRMGVLADSMPGAYVHIARNSMAYSAKAGLRALASRHIVTETEGVFAANPDKASRLRYYANSVRHLVPGAPENAADARL